MARRMRMRSHRRSESTTTLRPPKPVFDRIKIPLILLAYSGISEWADPFPFNVSLPARIAVAVFLLFALREFHHARLEVDEDWVRRTARADASVRKRASRISRQTVQKIGCVG